MTTELHPEAHPDVVAGLCYTGRLPAKSDPRTPSILKMLSLTAPKITIPGAVTRTNEHPGGRDWGMLGNDQYGDCEWAEYAHTMMLWGAVEGKQVPMTAQDVTDAYFKYTGGPDTGSVMLDCANLRLKNKWANFGQACADAFVGLDLGTRLESAVKASVYVLGSASLGVGLPLALQKTPYDWTHVPTAAERRQPQWQPGSWGGHAVDALDYDEHGVTIITWSKPTKVSWGMLQYIMDEGIGYSHPLWRNRKGKSPTGLTAAQIHAYIKNGAL